MIFFFFYIGNNYLGENEKSVVRVQVVSSNSTKLSFALNRNQFMCCRPLLKNFFDLVQVWPLGFCRSVLLCLVSPTVKINLHLNERLDP